MNRLPGFDELYAAADGRAEAAPVVVAGGADRTVLEALSTAERRGWVQPILAGDAAEIRTLAEDCGIDLRPFRIVDSPEPAVAAVAEVRAGRARMLMKGQIATPDLMRAVLQPDVGLRTGRVLCQVVLMELPRDDRRLLLADTGVTIAPNLKQKIDILQSCVEVARSLQVAEPRVAVMSATEKQSDAMPDTVEAAELTQRSQQGEFPHCVVQGPLSFDLAYATDAGEKKRIGGDVVGAADILLFPNLLSANLTVKAIMYTADCRFGGVIRGAACPIVFMSRADSTTTRLNSLAYALRSSGL
jgi:phosphotransacetylase